MKDANGNDLKILDRVTLKGFSQSDIWRVISNQDELGGVNVKNITTGEILDRSPLNLIKAV